MNPARTPTDADGQASGSPAPGQVPRPWHGVDHAENFPVGSWLVPAQLRPAVLAIYRFARHADDLADEGDVPTSEREVALQALHSALDEAARGVPSGVPVVDGLVASVQRHGLHWRHFHDLLDAFLQDLRVTRYDTEAEVQDYCRRSANPVGRLLLQLYGVGSDTALAQSDAICSALQRINFLQDIGIDAAKDLTVLVKRLLTKRLQLSSLVVKLALTVVNLLLLLQVLSLIPRHIFSLSIAKKLAN